MAGQLKEETIKNLVSKCATTARDAASYLPPCSSQELLPVANKGPYREEVTEYDKRLEERIFQTLIHFESEDGYLGEETGHLSGKSGLKWIVDPIDGTSNFARRIPAYVISIAAEVDGEVVAGAVYDPSHQDTFVAGLGLGAHCNGYKISSSNPYNLSDAIVSTGFSRNSGIRKRQAQLLSNVLTEVRDIRSCGSAALELCWLAAGKLDAYYEHDLCYWDLAAGALIASEAGVEVQIQGDLVVASAPSISHKFSGLIKRFS